LNNLSEKDLEELLKLKRQQKKKSRFSKFIVTLVILLNVVFTLGVFYVFLNTGGNEPSTLIGSWFAFTTVELWSLSKIKRDKVKGENKDEY